MSELDDRVAREVMEFVEAQEWSTGELKAIWILPGEEEQDKATFIYKEQFRPRTSWADAGRVIKRMEELHWDLDIERLDGCPYRVRFGKGKGYNYERYEGHYTSDDLKEAISRAALEAVSSPEETHGQ